MTTAMIYARFSDRDREDESSLDDQVRICTERAAREGWTILETYREPRVSGYAFGNRPEFLRMRELALAGRVNILLVNDTTRLARSQDLAPLVARLRFNGVRVIGVQDAFDSEAETADMQAGLSGIMSADFIRTIRRRTHAALESRAKDGRPTGGKAYDNADVVREIFARFAAGETLKAIAGDLNRRGVPSPGANWKQRSSTRGKWFVSTLHTLLQNERYIGRVVWNRSQWVKDPDTGIRKRRERPPSQWIVGSCEPIVDATTWARAQARFTAGAGGGGRSYLLSGLLSCALCGSKLVIIGGTLRRYGCGAYHAGGEHACANRSTFPRLAAEHVLLEHVRERMLSDEALSEGVKMLREARAAAERPAGPDPELAELERLVREGVLSAEVAAPSLAEARRRARERQADIANLPWPTEAKWREAVQSMSATIEGDDVGAAREILRRLLGAPIPCRPEGAFVVATVAKRRVLLTGTGSPVYGVVAGACYELAIRAYTRLYKE